MERRTFLALVPASLLATPLAAEAQQTTKVTSIGYLSGPSLSANAARIEAFRQGLRELSYVEGKNIVIEWRSADGKFERLPALAAELVRLKVAVIVTSGGALTRRAKEATSTIPIVMTNDPDPVGDGFVASLARPGGNITGLSTFAPEVSGKRLEILREVVPKLSRVAVLGSSTATGYAQTLKEIEPAAKAFKMQLQFLDVLHAKDIETAFQAASKGRAQGVLTLNSAILGSQRAQIAELAVKTRLPVMYHQSDFVEVGGLIFYGVNVSDLNRRAATYVDKILKGAKPGDLPVEQPTKFELAINLKTAKDARPHDPAVTAAASGSGDRVTEGRPAAEQPPIDAARRAALMFATLGFAALPRVPADMAPVFQALHQWLDGWKGIGDLKQTALEYTRAWAGSECPGRATAYARYAQEGVHGLMVESEREFPPGEARPRTR
jgi:putative ABC transport system substrate-binding protein